MCLHFAALHVVVVIIRGIMIVHVHCKLWFGFGMIIVVVIMSRDDPFLCLFLCLFSFFVTVQIHT